MVKMFRRKYRINPETLLVEKAELPVKQKVILGASIAALLILCAVGMRVLYDFHAKSPRLVYLEKQNVRLRQEYKELFDNLRMDEDLLAQFRRKDDRMYRSIFGMEPLPSSIRDAGTGGAVMHSNLSSISDPDLIFEVFDKVDKVLSKAMIQSNSFEDLEKAARYNQQLLARKPLIHPISPDEKFWMTSTFGYRIDPFTKTRKAHQGIDFAGEVGIKIHSTGDGTVIHAGYNRHGYGNEVVIDHGFGYESRYAHLKKIDVKAGDAVTRGAVIGYLGNSGRSTGPHLHYEVLLNERAINPIYCFYEDLTPEEYRIISSRATIE